MSSANPDTPTLLIEAASKRQVMDWSLVLASQAIPATILHSPNGWGLEVEPEDYQSALAAIRQYQTENRRWGWHRPIPWSEATFHWASLGWCLVIILVHFLTPDDPAGFRASGVFDTKRVLSGEWWRTLTAVWLHADLAHLVANATSGFLLLGLAMARYGVGVATLCAYLAGAAGNLVGLMLYSHPYTGLGASGMVLGALGLISIPPLSHPRWRLRARRHLFQILFAGIFLFLLLGTDPSSDVIAHGGGFVTGALMGVGLNLLPRALFRNRALIVTVWVLLLGAFAGPLWLALSSLKPE